MTTEPPEPRPAPDRVILGVVAAYAASFVALGFLVQTPAELLRGLGAILTTRDALLTDYFGVGGIGGGCVSAGLLTLAAVCVYWRTGAKMTGAAVACLFLVLGFGLFGKNLLNVWPIVAGVALYARFRRRTVPSASQHRVFRSGAGADLLRNPVLDRPRAPLQRSARARDRARGRLHPAPRSRAPLPDAHGLQPLQHGLHCRRGRNAGRGDVQGVRLRARSGFHLDQGREWAPVGLPRTRVRVDGRGRIRLRPSRPRSPRDHPEGAGAGADRFHRAGRVRRDARQHGPLPERSASFTCWRPAATSTARRSARS